MKKNMYIWAVILLCFSAACAPRSLPPTSNAVESVEEEDQHTQGTDNYIEDYEYLFEQNMGTGKYVFANGAMQKLQRILGHYSSPSDVKYFVSDPEPIISVIRSGDYVNDQGISVIIVDHFGISQPATILFDDGKHVAIKPDNPLKDGMYFVIDDYSSASGQNLHSLDYFYIWHEKDTKLAQIGEFITGIYGDSPSNALFSYYDLISITPLTTPLANVSDNVAVNTLPETTEGTLAFVANMPSYRRVRFTRYIVGGWGNIGISASGDNCRVWELDDLGIQNGFQVNDEILAVNDVPRFADDNMTACWALDGFLENQTMGHNLSITIKRGSETIVLENILFNISKDIFDTKEYALQTIHLGDEEVTIFQTKAPLLDGLYCFYEDYAENNYRYCFWKN